VSQPSRDEEDLAAAKAAAARLQEAATGGTPVAIPASLSNVGTTSNPSLEPPAAPHPTAPPAAAPFVDTDSEEIKLEGGGTQ
jgi:predicted component of type VI protein secretion system